MTCNALAFNRQEQTQKTFGKISNISINFEFRVVKKRHFIRKMTNEFGLQPIVYRGEDDIVVEGVSMLSTVPHLEQLNSQIGSSTIVIDTPRQRLPRSIPITGLDPPTTVESRNSGDLSLLTPSLLTRNAETTIPAGFPEEIKIGEKTEEIHETGAVDFSYFSPGKFSTYASSQFIDKARPMRFKTKKVIQLTPYGIFSVDIPVPEKVIASGRYTKSNEFTHLRYTAVCCDPNEYISSGYHLRVGETGRQTEIMIAITLYNEEDDLFINTWSAIEKNIKHLCSKKDSPVWGKCGWQKIVVVIIADGREKIKARVLTILGLLGIYQDGLIKTSVASKRTACHLFEYTTQVSAQRFPLGTYRNQSFPIQTIFCLKEDNLKKINSHRWFFNAFAASLNPMCCILLDVGTRPTPPSFYRLWKTFDDFPRVAGACGEIYPDTGKFMTRLLNPLVAAQNFEYKISNILDKPMESTFGFISVLPGAFSAYRFAALMSYDGSNDNPLDKYFLGEKVGRYGTRSLSTANMYLAEDRVLCFELVTRKNASWILQYVSGARAATDVPSTIPEFISQRRRWLNGSMFAALHSIWNFYQIFRSSHSWSRKLSIVFEIFYQCVTVIVTWFGISNFFLIFYFVGTRVINSTDSDPFFGHGKFVFVASEYVYLFCTITIFILCLGNRPQGSPLLYTICFILYAVWMAVLVYMIIMNISMSLAKQNSENPGGTLFQLKEGRNLLASAVATYGGYVIGSVIYLQPWHLVTSIVQYTLFLPSLTNILMTYAFCNIHDISWGTKGETHTEDCFPVQVTAGEKNAGRALTATVDLPVNQDDIDEMYEVYLARMRKSLHRTPTMKKPGLLSLFRRKVKGDDVAKEDYFKSYRTNILLMWVSSNLIMVIAMVSLNNSHPHVSSIYFSVILWTVASLTVVRLTGSIVYKIHSIRFG